jgi:3-oxoacyl-[acyl-carrier-protein] synthase-1
VSVATEVEKNLIKTDKVCLGEGLTKAFERVFASAGLQARSVDHVICDMNGEAYRADEYGFASIRTDEYFIDAGKFLTPADCWGDVGAASGPLFALLAVAAAQRGYSPGSLTLLWTSSESGERSAALVDTSAIQSEATL